jgi:hypothetical protein
MNQELATMEQKSMRIINLWSRLLVRTIVLATTIAGSFAGDARFTAGAHSTEASSYERRFSPADHAVNSNLGAGVPVSARYGNLPLSFETNHGQSHSRVRFLSRGNGYNLFLTTNEAVLVLSEADAHESRKVSGVAGRADQARDSKSTVVRMTLVSAHPRLRVTGHDELAGKANYFIGNDPAQWRTNISTYAKVKYEGVYPGVDLV